MLKKMSTLLSGMLFALAPVYAQCPAVGSLTASATTTAAQCPSSGTATIGTNAPAGQSLIYTIISGPSGAPVNNPQNAAVFNALLAGNYIVKVECANGAMDTVSFTITNNYVPIAAIQTTVTNNCGTHTQGGTVTINGVTGGKAPLQYSIVKQSDANYPDNLSQYNSSTTKLVNSYGTFQVRVKDACNQFFTQTVVVEPTLPPVQMGYWQILNDQACSASTFSLYYTLYDPVTDSYKDQQDYINAGGIKVTIYEKAPGACAPSGLPLLQNQVITQNNIVIPKVPSAQYYIQVVSPCGDTMTSCDNYSNSLDPDMWIYTKSAGCQGSATNPPTQSIRQLSQAYLNYPVTVTVKNSANVTVYTQTLNTAADIFSVTGLPIGDYTINIVDECGTALVRNSWNPTTAGALSLSVNGEELGSCFSTSSQTQSGTKQVLLELNGYVGDFDHAVVSILSGPSNVGQQGANVPAGSNIFGWSNMLPGNYVIKVVTACDSLTFPHTVNANGLLVQQVTAAAASNCGGGGTVTATINYNAYYSVNYVLVNAATLAALDSNSTGTFGNLPAGNYLVKMKLNNYCTGQPYYINSNTVTITAPGAGPQIVKKIGLVCEDPVTGVPTGTGNVYLELSGGTPRILEYKLAGAATWINYSNNAPQNVTISGLTPGGVYDVRVTSCGISAATQVAIEAMQPLNTTTESHPCAGSPYSLDAPQIAGAAYEWRNPANVVVSNTYNYTIASYNSSYNGQYTCKVSFGNCVTRTITVSITSTACGTPLPIDLVRFGATAEGCKVSLNWETANALNFDRFELQRSKDGLQFAAISTIPFRALQMLYAFNDYNPAEGTNYYRLKLIDRDGAWKLSTIAQAVSDCITGTTLVYPNPAKDKLQIHVPGAAASVQLRIMDLSGRTIPVPVADKGQGNLELDVHHLANGTYLLHINGNNTNRTTKVTVQH